VLRAITQFGAIVQSPGVIDFTASGYTLIEQSPRSEAIAGVLTACDLDGRVSDDIKTEVWRKLIFNCVINPITSITGSDVGGIADARLDPLKQLVIDECLAVARSDGVDFSVDFLTTIAEVFGPSRNIASMRQDLLRGRPTEIDHMNGAVVDLGRRAGIDCPVNAALVAIIKAMDRHTMSSATRVGIVAVASARGDAASHRHRIVAGRARARSRVRTATAVDAGGGGAKADTPVLVAGVDLLVVRRRHALSVADCAGAATSTCRFSASPRQPGILTEATLPERPAARRGARRRRTGRRAHDASRDEAARGRRCRIVCAERRRDYQGPRARG
jgi:hypothetical protein